MNVLCEVFCGPVLALRSEWADQLKVEHILLLITVQQSGDGSRHPPCSRCDEFPAWVVDLSLYTRHKNFALHSRYSHYETIVLLNESVVSVQNHAEWRVRMRSDKRLVVRPMYIVPQKCVKEEKQNEATSTAVAPWDGIWTRFKAWLCKMSDFVLSALACQRDMSTGFLSTAIFLETSFSVPLYRINYSTW